MPDSTVPTSPLDRLMPGQLRRDLGEKLSQWMGNHGLGEISLLLPPKPVADDTTKFMITDARQRPAAVLICSSAVEPQSVAKQVALTVQVRQLLGDPLNRAILTPLGQGEIGNLSYVVWPWCQPLSDRFLLRRWQDWRLRSTLFCWLGDVTRCTAVKIPAAGLEHAVIGPLSYLSKLKQLPAAMLDAAIDAGKRAEAGRWQPRHVLMHNDLWRGNILIRPKVDSPGRWIDRFVIIDWGGCVPLGYGLYDLVRLADSMRLRGDSFRAQIAAHCASLECDRQDAMSHLLTALGHLAMHLNHFPIERFAGMAQRCFDYLRRHGE